MKEYKVTAIYKVRKELIVWIPEGKELHESNWDAITSEQDLDCWLQEVVTEYEPVE